jgi:hypothetical protein
MKSEIENIAARFPGLVTLYPSRKKWLLVFLGSAPFYRHWLLDGHGGTKTRLVGIRCIRRICSGSRRDAASWRRFVIT